MKQYIRYPQFDFSQCYYKSNKSNKIEIAYYLNFISSRACFTNINEMKYEYKKR